MYRGAETSSSFYQSMRSAYAPASTTPSHSLSSGALNTAPPSSRVPLEASLQRPGSNAAAADFSGRATMAEIQHRLRNMGRLPASSVAPSTSAAVVAGEPTLSGGYAHQQASSSSSLLQSAQQLLQRQSVSPMQPAVQATSAPSLVSSEPIRQSPPQVGVDEDETLSPAELRSLKMVEFAAPVCVLLGELQHPPRPLQLLAEEANVKIFPRHVYISRPPNGSPIAEIVILELSELTEDANKGTLTFYIRRASNASTTTIVELRCSDPAARSAMYKIVCSKRSALEAAVVTDAAATLASNTDSN